MADTAYIHGTEPPEQARLSDLNSQLNAACVRELELRGGERVLDVGSGLGQLSRALLRAGAGSVLGIERNPRQLAEACRLAKLDHGAEGGLDELEFRAGDAESLPLDDDERGAFDVALARFVLEHVQRPLEVVRQMVAAVRPGGRICLADDHHPLLTLDPPCPAFAQAWDAYQRSYDRIGCDPRIGSRLVSLLHAAGAQPVRNSFVFFGGCAGDGRFKWLVGNAGGVVETARTVMVAGDLITSAALDAALRALREWGDRRDAAIWYAICWAEGRKVDSA